MQYDNYDKSMSMDFRKVACKLEQLSSDQRSFSTWPAKFPPLCGLTHLDMCLIVFNTYEMACYEANVTKTKLT